TNECHGGSDLLFTRTLTGVLISRFRWHWQRVVLLATLWNVATKFLAAFLQVFDFRGVLSWMIVRHGVLVFFDFFIGERNTVTITEEFDLVDRQFLHLVGRVATFEGSAQAVALNGVRQNDSWFALVFSRSLVRGIDFLVVVTTAFQTPDFLVRHICDEFLGGRGASEEVLANETTVFSLISLVVTIWCLVHNTNELTRVIGFQQWVPFATPQYLDDIPASTAERSFKFLDNLAITANRAVQTLEVTVDDKRDVVQLVVGSNVECTARFWLIHFTVTKECPDVLVRGVFDAAVMNVAVELCLVNRVQWAQAHRHSWELPEVVQHFGVRVGGQSVWSLRFFLAETIELFFGESAFQECSCIVTRGGVALEVDLVATTRVVLAAEEVVEPNFI